MRSGEKLRDLTAREFEKHSYPLGILVNADGRRFVDEGAAFHSFTYAFNLPVVSHLVPEIHVHLVAAVPNGLTVEYMPWTLRLYEETPALEGGQLMVPKKPGLGLAFDQSALKRHRVG